MADKIYKKIPSNAGLAVLSEAEKNIDEGMNLKEGRRGLLFFLIVFILRNFATEERPRTKAEIYLLIKMSYGFGYSSDKRVEKNLGAVNLVGDYLDFLSEVSAGDDDEFDTNFSKKMIRKQIGGVVRYKGDNPHRYYFVPDYDTAGFELARSFVDRAVNADLGMQTGFSEDDRGYVAALCDMFAPIISAGNLTNLEVKKIRVDSETGERIKRQSRIVVEKSIPRGADAQKMKKTATELIDDPERVDDVDRFQNAHFNSVIDRLSNPVCLSSDKDDQIFFGIYRTVSDVLKKQRENNKADILIIKERGSKPGSAKNSDTRYIPLQFMWEKNLLYLQCQIQGSSETADLRIRDIEEISRVKKTPAGEVRVMLFQKKTDVKNQ